MDCLVRFRPRAVCVDSRLRLRSRPRTAGGGDAGLLFGKKQRYIKCSCKKNNVIVFFSFFSIFLLPDSFWFLVYVFTSSTKFSWGSVKKIIN